MAYPEGWVTLVERGGIRGGVTLLAEVEGSRAGALPALVEIVLGHYADTDRLRRLGRSAVAAVLETKLPKTIRVRSGDLCEIIASEWIEENTSFALPIKRLRWKDGREVSMRGDDLLALSRADETFTILKGETKSRRVLRLAAVEEALEQLDREAGRPQAHTLAFVADRLDELGREADARFLYDALTRGIAEGELEHLIFTLSGNDPSAVLGRVVGRALPLRLVGLHIPDHQEFIAAVFEACHADLG